MIQRVVKLGPRFRRWLFLFLLWWTWQRGTQVTPCALYPHLLIVGCGGQHNQSIPDELASPYISWFLPYLIAIWNGISCPSRSTARLESRLPCMKWGISFIKNIIICLTVNSSQSGSASVGYQMPRFATPPSENESYTQSKIQNFLI